MQVGLPEARIPLADAAILVAISPKSNSAYNAINAAFNTIQSGKIFPIPRNLQNVHCDSTHTQKQKEDTYLYPHDFKNHWVFQQYLPDEMKNFKFFSFSENKTEQSFKSYLDNLKGTF